MAIHPIVRPGHFLVSCAAPRCTHIMVLKNDQPPCACQRFFCNGCIFEHECSARSLAGRVAAPAPAPAVATPLQRLTHRASDQGQRGIRVVGGARHSHPRHYSFTHGGKR